MVVDISKRLWIIDMRNGKLLFSGGYVAQRKGTGILYTTLFSKQPGSDTFSIGAIITG